MGMDKSGNWANIAYILSSLLNFNIKKLHNCSNHEVQTNFRLISVFVMIVEACRDSHRQRPLRLLMMDLSLLQAGVHF